MLTVAVRFNSGNPDTPTVEFSDMLLARLIDFCKKFALVTPHVAQMRITDEMFIRSYIDNLVYEDNYQRFWDRWCIEGIPDPNNIPQPIYGEKRNQTVETSNYMLSHPFGTERLPRY
jgi:hypothetical protein